MQRTLLIGLILLTACQPDLPLTTATPARFIPTLLPASSPQGITATPAPTSTPALTPTPPPRFLVEEFEHLPAHWTTLYASGEPERTALLQQDGKLLLELYGSNTWLYAIYDMYEYDAVHLETRVEASQSNLNYMGLVCHYDEQKGWYEFNLSSEGAYSLLYGQWLAEGIARYTLIRSEASDRIARGNAINELGLDCAKNNVQLYINGKLIRKIDVSRFGLTGGKIGLTAASFDDLPVILAFDWIKIEAP